MTSPSLTLEGMLLESTVPLREERFVPRFVIVISSPFEVSWTCLRLICGDLTPTKVFLPTMSVVSWRRLTTCPVSVNVSVATVVIAR